MVEQKIKIGAMRPIYQPVGFEVCKVVSEKEEEQVWVQTEKQIEAEILSALLMLSALLKK